jgi:hypothetical protein
MGPWLISSDLGVADTTGCSRLARFVQAAASDTCCGDIGMVPFQQIGIRFLGNPDSVDVLVDPDCYRWELRNGPVSIPHCPWLTRMQSSELKAIVEAMLSGAHELEPGR